MWGARHSVTEMHMTRANQYAARTQRALAVMLTLFAMSFLCLGTAFAQFEKSTIGGTVTDASGAVVVGAKITVTGVGTNSVRTATTDNTGSYLVTNVAPGAYEVRASQTGFGDVKQTVQ